MLVVSDNEDSNRKFNKDLGKRIGKVEDYCSRHLMCHISKCGGGYLLYKSRKFFIKIAEDKVTKVRTTVTVGIYKDAKRMESVNVKFIGPMSTANH